MNMNKRKILAAGGIVTALLLSRGTRVIPGVYGLPQTEVQDEATVALQDSSSADLGVKANDSITDPVSRQSSMEILASEGFSSAQIHRILKGASDTDQPTRGSDDDSEDAA